MSEFWKKCFVDLALGLACAIVAAFLFGLFHADTVNDVFRILSDCFFLPGVLMLATAGLTWTKNGGVWDGIGYSIKSIIDRMRFEYEKDRITFAEYREEREKKKSSPMSALFAGLIYLIVALILLVAYNMTL